MRTTLSIEDRLYEAARRLAFEERRTLGSVVNELIADGLAARASAPRQLGTFAGQIVITDDFDEPLPELDAELERPVDP